MNQINETFETKEEWMKRYLDKVKREILAFETNNK